MTVAPRQLRHLLQLNTLMLAFIIRGAGVVVLPWFDFFFFFSFLYFWKSSEALGWDGEGYRLSFMRETETDVLKSCFNDKADAGFLP